MTDITLPRAELEQVLEALENLQGLCTDAQDGWVEAVTIWTPEIITALRERLAQPEQKPAAEVKLMMTGANAGIATRIVEIDDPMRERLHPGQMLYTAPPQRKPEQELVIDCPRCGHCCPQRKEGST